MTPLDYLMAFGGLIGLSCFAGVFIAACIGGEPHTEEDDAEQLRAIQPDWSLTERLKQADMAVTRRQRLPAYPEVYRSMK